MTLTVVPPLPLTPLSIQAPALPRRRIYSGDSLWVLAHLMPDSLDALVCDPPAGIGFMGKEWDTFGSSNQHAEQDRNAAYDKVGKGASPFAYSGSGRSEGDRDQFIASIIPIFRQCLRVLKPGAHGLVWALPRTSHWTATALEEAGFEVRDLFQHWFGSGFPKSMDISKAIDKAAGAAREVTEEAKRWEGWGTALKPAVEMWWLVRKPLNGSVVENVLSLGTGALNIDASRIGIATHAAGRWPSHLLLTHAASCRRVGSKVVKAASEPVTMDESEFDAVPVAGVEEVAVFECDPSCPIRRLDEQTGTLTSGVLKRGTVAAAEGTDIFGSRTSYVKDKDYGGDSGGASRFFQTFEQEPDPFLYAAKASRSDREGCIDGSRITTPAIHPTVKPTKLMEYLIRMVTPPGGTVLDPFGGSGTTAVAAARLGFGYVLCEREPQYLDIICQRLQVERSTVMSLRLIQGGAAQQPVPAAPPRNFLVVHPKGLSEEEMHVLWTQIGQALIPAAGGQPFELTMALADWRVNFEKSGGWQEWINSVVGRGYASGDYRYAGFVVAGRVLGQASAEIVKLALVRRAPVVIYEPGAPLRVASRVYQISADWREGFRVD
jgi:DNA modification methylase